jgi:dTDP-4-dehydrorhamnose 3,5-epimerase
MYKCDQFYNKDAEAGIRFDDPELNIDWKVDLSKAIISPKDAELPSLSNCQHNFIY